MITIGPLYRAPAQPRERPAQHPADFWAPLLAGAQGALLEHESASATAARLERAEKIMRARLVAQHLRQMVEAAAVGLDGRS